MLGSGTLPPLVAGVSRPGNVVMGASSERLFPPDLRSVVGAFFCSRKNEQRKIPVVVGFLGVCRSRGVVEFPNCNREWAAHVCRCVLANGVSSRKLAERMQMLGKLLMNGRVRIVLAGLLALVIVGGGVAWKMGDDLVALKSGSVSELQDSPEVRGMINKIAYLVKVL